MRYNLIYRHTDFCPYLGCDHSIKITYAEIPIVGRLSPGYKAMSYSCDLSEECPYPQKDQYGRCPVYLSAPNEPN